MIDLKENTPIYSSKLTPLNVLHVGAGFGQRGGVASVIAEIASTGALFGKEGVSLSFFATRGFRQPINLIMFSVVDIPRFAIAMKKDLDIVHFHVSSNGSFYRKFVLFAIARLHRKKTVFHWHSSNLKEFRSEAGAMVARALTHFVRGADAVVGVSEDVSRDLRYERGTAEGMFTIGNSASAAEYAAKSSRRHPTSGDSNLPYIAFAGSLVLEKGIADLFAAIALLKAEGCLVALKLAGTGDVRAWMRQAKELKIDDQIEFVGWLAGDDKLQFYKGALAFCSPSYRESFGIVTLEAMFCSVAVVGTRTAGSLALVDDGLTGYLVAPGDPNGLANRIKKLLGDPDRAREMGHAGYERARQLYSVNVVTEKYVRCYRYIAEKKK